MLSQAVLAAYTQKAKDGIHTGQLTVTGVSPCSYATYLNYHHLDDEDFDPLSRLRMKNGKWQELEVLEDLRKAGFILQYTGSNQLTVHVGKVPTTGRPDGIISVGGKEDMLEVKAMSLAMFTDLRQKGVDSFPGYKCQVQLYLASVELRDRVDGCWFYAKHKDSCRPYDLFVERDESYSKPIIEAVEEIVLGKIEVKKPSDCPVQGFCRHRGFCKEADTLDMSGIKLLTKDEVVHMWLEGQFHLDLGKQLNEEARVLLKEYLGSDDVLFIEGREAMLEVKKILSHRSKFNESKFVEKYSAIALSEVMDEFPVPQMRVRVRE